MRTSRGACIRRRVVTVNRRPVVVGIGMFKMHTTKPIAGAEQRGKRSGGSYSIPAEPYILTSVNRARQDRRRLGIRKRGRGPFVRSTRRAVPAKGSRPFFRRLTART